MHDRPNPSTMIGLTTPEGSSEGYAPAITYYTKYHSVTGSITSVATDVSLSMGSVTTAYSVTISNKTTESLLQVKLNTTSNDSIMIGDLTSEDLLLTKSITKQKIDKIFLRNTSGKTISYDIDMQGV